MTLNAAWSLLPGELCGRKYLADVRGQIRSEENGPIPGDTKATVTEIIAGYNKGMQNSIFKDATG